MNYYKNESYYVFGHVKRQSSVGVITVNNLLSFFKV